MKYLIPLIILIACNQPSVQEDANSFTPNESNSTEQAIMSLEPEPEMSELVYQQLNDKWKQQMHIDLPLSRKILKSLQGKHKIFTVNQFWDNCSTFEYAIVVDHDSSFITAFPFSVLESSCEADMEIITEQLNDSIFNQQIIYTEPIFELNTTTNELNDSWTKEIETIKFRLTSDGIDTLSYSIQSEQ